MPDPSQQAVKQNRQSQIYQLLTSEDDGRLCKDIPDTACNQQAPHFLIHLVSLAASKTADGLIDPKLILSWLLTQLGASAGIIGLLVPIREAGALLPQLAIAEWIRRQPQRKWVWATGALIQGICALAMVLVTIFFSGNLAGWLILILLGLLAIARSACSVSYKDVLGKTVSKSTRGTATGSAASTAGLIILAFGSLIATGIVSMSTRTILIAMASAGACWIFAAVYFTRLNEESGATEGGENASRSYAKRLKHVLTNRQLILFISVRGLLIATALAPPYILLLASQTGQVTSLPQTMLSGSGGNLGLLILASALASLFSSYIWGRLSDQSSRKVLMISALIASLGLVTIALVSQFSPDLLTHLITLPGLLFILMIAYQGVRLGRSTHLVDMSNEKQRADFTAVSNSAIGVLLLFGSGFAWIGESCGLISVFYLFSLLCGTAFVLCLFLDEVQQNNPETIK